MQKSGMIYLLSFGQKVNLQLIKVISTRKTTRIWRKKRMYKVKKSLFKEIFYIDYEIFSLSFTSYIFIRNK